MPHHEILYKPAAGPVPAILNPVGWQSWAGKKTATGIDFKVSIFIDYFIGTPKNFLPISIYIHRKN